MDADDPVILANARYLSLAEARQQYPDTPPVISEDYSLESLVQVQAEYNAILSAAMDVLSLPPECRPVRIPVPVFDYPGWANERLSSQRLRERLNPDSV